MAYEKELSQLWKKADDKSDIGIIEKAIEDLKKRMNDDLSLRDWSSLEHGKNELIEILKNRKK